METGCLFRRRTAILVLAYLHRLVFQDRGIARLAVTFGMGDRIGEPTGGTCFAHAAANVGRSFRTHIPDGIDGIRNVGFGGAAFSQYARRVVVECQASVSGVGRYVGFRPLPFFPSSPFSGV